MLYQFASVFLLFCCSMILHLDGFVMQVSDLKNLIGLYSEWHSLLLPYYSFDQFVHKVEQVGATKRVRVRITLLPSCLLKILSFEINKMLSGSGKF